MSTKVRGPPTISTPSSTDDITLRERKCMLMTETKPPADSEDTPRCRVGSKAENPCWRQAVEKVHPDEAEPTLCYEHSRAMRLGQEAEERQSVLYDIEEWKRGRVAEARSGYLERLVWRMLEEAREEFAKASAAAYAAKLVADLGPPEEGQPRLMPEQAEKLTQLIIRADSFVNARAALEDLPEEAVSDRWVTIHALVVAAHEANEEVNRHKAELGL
jgi:hypothetical protein